MKKNIKIYILGVSILLTGCTQVDNIVLGKGIKEEHKIKAPKEKIVKNEEVDDIRCNKETGKCDKNGKMVTYDYITEKKKVGNFKFEEGDSYTNTEVVSDNILKMYSGDHFYKDNKGDVYEIEHGATTTVQAFADQTKLSLWDKIFGREAIAACGDSGGSCYAGAGDGRVSYGPPDTWDNVHDALTGDTATPTATEDYQGGCYGNYTIWRYFLPIDTSAIPSGATIDTAVVKMWTLNTYADDADANGYVAIVQTTQPSETTFTTADYDLAGTISGSPVGTGVPDEGSDQLTLGGLSTGQYNDLTLDATGRGWVKTSGDTSKCGTNTGWTCLGLREGHDINDDPINSGAVHNAHYGANSEYTGTDKDPYIVITYTEVTPVNPPLNPDMIILDNMHIN